MGRFKPGLLDSWATSLQVSVKKVEVNPSRFNSVPPGI